MGESRHSEIRLSLTEGTADKEYQAWLEQVMDISTLTSRTGGAAARSRRAARPRRRCRWKKPQRRSLGWCARRKPRATRATRAVLRTRQRTSRDG